jgi:hypothetical protein
LGNPAAKASNTASSEGPFAKSRHAEKIELIRAAALNTIFQTTGAVHFQPWSFSRIDSISQLNTHR